MSIEELNLEIPKEHLKNENEIILNSSPEEILIKKSKSMKKSNTLGKKKKKKMIDSHTSSSSPNKKGNPYYDYSPLTKTKDKMPKQKVPQEVKKLQNEQNKIFNGFKINPNMNLELRPDEYNDMVVPPLKKNSIWRKLFCCEGKSKLTKWFLDGDSISLSGDTYKLVKHVDLTEYEEQAIFRKLVKMFKSAPTLENLTIAVVTEYELNQFLDVIHRILFSSNQFEVVKQLKISSIPDERLLWATPQFVHTNFIMPPYNIVPKINPWVDIKHVFRKYIDKGARKDEIVQLINVALKKFEKSADLQLLHMKFSSWDSIGDEVLRASSSLLWKLGFHLRELVLHFCGNKISDYGVKEVCETIVSLKCKKMIALGFGIDSRNLEVTDESLRKISETLLFVSEKAYLRSFSLLMVSQVITDYGLWCVGQALQKVADRLNNLVILVGSIAGITDRGVQDLVEGVMKCGKNLRSVSLGFLSWEVSKYGLRVIEANLCLPFLNLEMCHLYYSNQGFESKKREEHLKSVISERHKSIGELDVFVFLN